MPWSAQTPFPKIAQALTPFLLRYVRRRLDDDAAAEDLVQETLIRIQRGLAEFDGRASVKTWAVAIARRVLADHFRRPDRQAHLDLDEAALAVADPGPGVEHRLALEQMSACVRQQIEALSPADRRVLMLHDIEETRIGDVAERCGCSDGAARVRLHRARKRLKQSLTENCDFYKEADNVLRCCRKDGDR
jgi:RNA polymerase sigma-70 factor, ECF subfamily